MNQYHTRIGDDDRAATAARLASALGEGRIDLAEFDRRTAAAAAATTAGELVPLTADLPVPAAQAQAEQRRRDLGEWLAEFDRRTAEAAAATTVGELVPLTADLPVPAEQVLAERRRREHGEWLAEWRYWLGGAVIMNAVWGVQSIRDGEPERYWPVVPIGIWAAVLVAVAIWPREKDD